MSRTIQPGEFMDIAEDVVVLDVRRKEDFDKSKVIVSGAEWRDPAQIDHWIDSVPGDKEVVIYCVRGGGVSNSVLDRLRSDGKRACFIEGGIVALEGSAGAVVDKAVK